MKEAYKPIPIDTQYVILSPEILDQIEIIAKNTHEVWSLNRIKDGWSYGEVRDDNKKQTPCLVPYDLLPNSEKEYDRKITIEILKLVIKLGFNISRK